MKETQVITVSNGQDHLKVGEIISMSDGKRYQVTEVISRTSYRIKLRPWWREVWAYICFTWNWLRLRWL